MFAAYRVANSNDRLRSRLDPRFSVDADRNYDLIGSYADVMWAVATLSDSRERLQQFMTYLRWIIHVCRHCIANLLSDILMFTTNAPCRKEKQDITRFIERNAAVHRCLKPDQRRCFLFTVMDPEDIGGTRTRTLFRYVEVVKLEMQQSSLQVIDETVSFLLGYCFISILTEVCSWHCRNTPGNTRFARFVACQQITYSDSPTDVPFPWHSTIQAMMRLIAVSVRFFVLFYANRI